MGIKIVPYNYGLDEAMEKDKENVYIGIEEISVTYTQESDTCSSSDDVQTITITTKSAYAPSKEDADKREGFYYDITIPEGQHWSVSNGEELKALIEDFEKRIYLDYNKDESSNK